VSGEGQASVRPRARPLDGPGEAAAPGTRRADAPVGETALLARVLGPHNLRRARQQVRRHQRAPGSDGRTVEALAEHLETHGPPLRAAWVEGTDAPQPVRRTASPKAGGGSRPPGIPPVRDRVIAHARLQIRQAAWGPTVAERSDGVRPPRRAHRAGEQAQASVRDGDTGVVDIDLGPCVERGNPAVLLSRVRRRVKARRVRTLLRRCLQAGGLPRAGSVAPTADGTPHGGPLAPLLAHLRPDAFGTAREKRGPRFARAADAAHIDGRSRQAGARGLARVARWLERPLRLTVNEATSAVDRPWTRTCLGCTCTRRRASRRQVSDKALKAFNAQGRARTSRPRGRTSRQSGAERRQLRRGWRAFGGSAEGRSPRRDRDQGMRRRRRSDRWQPGGRQRDRERRQRGVERRLAWTTGKPAHGRWRLRQRPARASALAPR
jgi:RNA-directed DNA polymerase